ncbi:MAG: alpha,alpha-trehalase TreF [Bacteroidetes bacterium]|nr:alpha,alpha-trehalase TreF [Bacteroidota bacterium]
MKIQYIHELGPLFEEVQMKNIFPDGKTFPDCIAKRSMEDLLKGYQAGKQQPGFDLKEFVRRNFELPKAPDSTYTSDLSRSPQEHINDLWNVLRRNPGHESSSLISLPFSYIVPGGRFREIYYWDSYFTMLGLEISHREDLIRNMIDNFAFLINRYGYIPNGNRTYFLGRSQPPFFALMVRLLSEIKGTAVLVQYLSEMEKEYNFWMSGYDMLNDSTSSVKRVVRMPDGSTLNRYWDESATPRPESYREDVELSHQSEQPADQLFRHLRAAAESGWDFSSRWFSDMNRFDTIHTTDIVPVDLNCLLYYLEHTLADAFQQSGNAAKASDFVKRMTKRKAAIRKHLWDHTRSFFFDYDFVAEQLTGHFNLAATFPLFFEIATPDQALGVEVLLREKFLKHGGLTTTLIHSGQQWDAPNGWAPLQWIASKGLMNYGFDDLGREVCHRWTQTVIKVYQKTGKMTEKYDVWNEDGAASGGEYPNQDGFGWTNGVFLAMMK